MINSAFNYKLCQIETYHLIEYFEIHFFKPKVPTKT